MSTMLQSTRENEEQHADSIFGFEKLQVWQKAAALASLIYKITADFPRHEMFGLVSQMRRAAISIAANVAEGNSRFSKTEQARFMEIAYGSLMELLAESTVAQQQKFLSEIHYRQLRSDAAEIARMLNNFRHALLKTANERSH